MLKGNIGKLSTHTIGACLITLAIAVGIFLPWYANMSLFNVIVSGLGITGSLGALGAKLDFSAMSNLITFIFVMLAVMALSSVGFGVRMIVTSFGHKTKGMTPCGVLIFVIALTAIGAVTLIGGVSSAQAGLWICLAAGLGATVWGIFA